MLLTALVLTAAMVAELDRGLSASRATLDGLSAHLALPATAPEPAPRFSPETRSVSNWRDEASRSLRPASLALVLRYTATEPAFVSRCVRLNNYWCIKSARWAGEIGADAEGHTGFAAAASGADAAAMLLRRYYREFNRRSALAIVRRWAPAECRLPAVASAAASAVSKAVAPLGLRKTLRARYLARNSRGGRPIRATALRVQPWSARALMARGRPAKPVPPVRVAGRATDVPPAPPQAPGLLVRPSVIIAKPSVLLVRPSELLVKPSVVTPRAEAKRSTRPALRPPATVVADRLAAESAALPAIASGSAAIPLLDLRVPPPLCANDETRIRNYAARIASAVGLKVEDDLSLFAPDGTPLPNLAPVMLAMSSVELGALRAGPALVEAAIAKISMGAAVPTPP